MQDLRPTGYRPVGRSALFKVLSAALSPRQIVLEYGERGSVEQLRAIIFVPDDGERDKWEAICLGICERKRYQVVALIVGAPGRWSDAMDMMYAHEADVVVVASRSHLPPDRTPRVESATEELPRFDAYAGRRTRVIRRDGAA